MVAVFYYKIWPKVKIFFKECNELLGFGLLEIEKIQAKIGRFFRFSFSK
jgi:hypothetical protein